jgi:hypothetical protein
MIARSTHPCSLPMASRHYLLRNNIMVPMIPVDQLPFQLQGISQQLSHRQMFEEGWKFVGESTEQASLLTPLAPTTQPSQPTTSPKPRHLPPDHDIRRGTATSTKDGMQPHQASRSQPVTVVTPSIPSPPTSGSASGHPSVLANRFARFEYRQPYPSGIEPDPAKKVYCTHWIRTGECAFTSVGCKYKHEMPHVEKLRELGFTLGTPKWFQEKAAIAARGPTWMQRRLAERASSQEPTDAATTPRVSSTLRSRSTDMRGAANERDTTRGVSVRPSSLKSALTPPPEPKKLSVPSVSSIPGLLIDIDDSSLEDSSSPSSAHSSASSAFSTAREVHNKNNKKWEQDRQAVRCCSPLSLTSGSEDEVTVLKSLPKRSTTTRKLAARTAAPSHQAGLTASKHAATNSKECHVVRSSHASSPSHKNGTARAVGAPSKTHRLKQKAGQPAAGKMRLVSKTAAPSRKVVIL